MADLSGLLGPYYRPSGVRQLNHLVPDNYVLERDREEIGLEAPPISPDDFLGSGALKAAGAGAVSLASLLGLAKMAGKGGPKMYPKQAGVIRGDVTPDDLARLYTEKAIKESKSRYNPETTYVNMSPDDFLLLSHGLDKTDPVVRENIDMLKAVGRFNDVPYLELGPNKKGALEVATHEGRHRANALKEKGITTMPVALKARYSLQKQFPEMTEEKFREWILGSKGLLSERGTGEMVEIVNK